MKTKLTLTVQKEVIENAKRIAKERNVSVSALFEEVFKEDTVEPVQTEKQRAVKRFISMIEAAEPVEALPISDKELYRKHLKEKYG